MFDLEFIDIPEYLKPFIRRITLFKSKDKLDFLQKITPSPYTCLSYNHNSIPEYRTRIKTYSFRYRLHLTGPKIDNDISVKYNGDLHQILIEFKPCVFYAIFGKSPSAYHNQLIQLEEFESFEMIRKLEADLKASQSTSVQIEIIGKYLIGKINNNVKSMNLHMQKAAAILQEKKGIISKDELLDNSFLCERHFNRLFKKWIGIPPKQFAKLVQLHAIIETLSHNKDLKLQDIAYMYDFYDAAHFINYFKNLTSSCPSSFLQRQDHIAMNYYRKILHGEEKGKVIAAD
jgi:AraC-like DNA-binding protein